MNSGTMKLWVNGSEVGSLNSVDNDTLALTDVKLGAMSVPDGIRGLPLLVLSEGTLRFDDFDSRRFSPIGLLPDPGLFLEDPLGGKLYSYDDPAHVHAVTSLSNGDAFTYDENGNMTCRTEGDNTYKQEYNAENRISSVELIEGSCVEPTSITSTWTFTYDGDGVKVMQVYTSGETTLTTRYYMGGSYEVMTDETIETVKKYYSIAGITVAMNDGTNLYYFLTDHLGSVMAVADTDGELVSEQRYMPFGQVRTDVGTLVTQTDFGYTFQRNMPDMGLMDYKARFYDANIGRFVQPDSIVPGAVDPGAWNRYTYVSNNPIMVNDPSGHGNPLPPNSPETEDKETRYIKDYIEQIFLQPVANMLHGGGYDYNEPNKHLGVDITYPGSLTAIRASGKGIVRISEPCDSTNCISRLLDLGGDECRNDRSLNNGYGNYVIVEYAYNNLPNKVIDTLNLNSGQSLYVLTSHLQAPSQLTVGQEVSQRTLIGYMGTTGCSTAEHLHLETRIGPSWQKNTNMNLTDWFSSGNYDARNPRLIWNIQS